MPAAGAATSAAAARNLLLLGLLGCAGVCAQQTIIATPCSVDGFNLGATTDECCTSLGDAFPEFLQRSEARVENADVWTDAEIASNQNMSAVLDLEMHCGTRDEGVCGHTTLAMMALLDVRFRETEWEAQLQQACSPTLDTAVTINPAHRVALEQIYNSSDGLHWSSHGSWLQSDACDWHGVHCCSDGDVCFLDLSGKGMQGAFPSALMDIRSLEYLSLSKNELSGPLPADVVRLSDLKIFDLDVNQFTGTLPVEWGSFFWMREFRARENFLTGPLPPQYASWDKLEVFDVGLNMFNGSLPPEYAAWTQLREFHVVHAWQCLQESGCCRSHDSMHIGDELSETERCYSSHAASLSGDGIQGTIPSAYEGWAELRVFDVSFNDIEGDMPLGASWTQLEEFYVNDNRISRNIRDDFLSSSPNLRILSLAANCLNGAFPDTSSWAQLSYLNIANNGFNGSVPALSSTLNLTTFIAGNNEFEGSLPGYEHLADKLEVLELGYNHLSGELPPSYGAFERLETLELQHNMMSGALPEWSWPMMSSCADINGRCIIDLSSNNISGTLPGGWAQIGVKTLLLRSNNITSISPDYQGDESARLERLDLSHNGLTDGIADLRVPYDGSAAGAPAAAFVHNKSTTPRWPHLKFLSFVGNRIAGDVCLTLRNYISLASLEDLVLDDNVLAGALDEQDCFYQWTAQDAGNARYDLGFQGLRRLSLAYNEITGEVPRALPQNLDQLSVAGNYQAHQRVAVPGTYDELLFLDVSDTMLQLVEVPPFWVMGNALTLSYEAHTCPSVRWSSCGAEGACLRQISAEAMFTSYAGCTCNAGHSGEAPACTLCPAGYYGEDGACVACPAGTYSTVVGAVGAEACELCSAVVGVAATSLPASASPDDCGCIDGFERVEGGCRCAPGSYILDEGVLECAPCAAGRYSDAYSETHSHGDDSCKECPAGRYQPETGADDVSDCLQCSSGRYSNETGADSADTCEFCASDLSGVAGANICPQAQLVSWWSAIVILLSCLMFVIIRLTTTIVPRVGRFFSRPLACVPVVNASSILEMVDTALSLMVMADVMQDPPFNFRALLGYAICVVFGVLSTVRNLMASTFANLELAEFDKSEGSKLMWKCTSVSKRYLFSRACKQYEQQIENAERLRPPEESWAYFSNGVRDHARDSVYPLRGGHNRGDGREEYKKSTNSSRMSGMSDTGSSFWAQGETKHQRWIPKKQSVDSVHVAVEEEKQACDTLQGLIQVDQESYGSKLVRLLFQDVLVFGTNVVVFWQSFLHDPNFRNTTRHTLLLLSFVLSLVVGMVAVEDVRASRRTADISRLLKRRVNMMNRTLSIISKRELLEDPMAIEKLLTTLMLLPQESTMMMLLLKSRRFAQQSCCFPGRDVERDNDASLGGARLPRRNEESDGGGGAHAESSSIVPHPSDQSAGTPLSR
uniref:Tyrosine-protein kinase ephrin type A/B receptor-like domain-containing protein n=1 Tax=Phaeomonas parva TaxID=124430 RepID=A0A6U4JS84_9STRA|mmetsp:Transcript_44979/g.140884  ORF Transcript_44979/g.140884 Transcript_44979/m.140884 type:complete len:1431 (+) Transcript_44979:307-4599(+)